MFQTNKIRIESKGKEGKKEYFIDYNKLVDFNEFLMDIITKFGEGKNILAVLDTEYSYDKNKPELEKRVNGIKKLLNHHGVTCRTVVTKKDSDRRIFGIKLQKPEKVNRYQLGLALTPEQLRDITEILRENVFFYMGDEKQNADEMTEHFFEVRGGQEPLDLLYATQIYNDSYFKRVRIKSRQDISYRIDEIKKKYQ